MAQGGLTAALLPAAVEEVGKSEAMADVEESDALGRAKLVACRHAGEGEGRV